MKRLTLVVLLAPVLVLAADSAIFNWVNPVTYTDGTALTATSIASTNIRCSALIINGSRTGCTLPSVNYPGAVTTGNTTFAFTDPRGGDICFQAQTVLITGAVSDWSTEACKTIAPKKPAPPTLFVIQ